jgi:glycosyltransferase involved in cell wall biosynthesis
MQKKKNLLIGQLPPPRHGMSSAFEILVQGFREQDIPHTIINASPGKHQREVGSISLMRLWQSFIFLLQVFFLVPTHTNIYVITAITRAGFFKDLVVLRWGFLFQKRIIVQMHSGNFGSFYQNEIKWIQRLIKNSYSRISDLVIEDASFADQFSDFKDRGMQIHAVGNCLPYNISEEDPPQKAFDGKVVKLLYLSNLFESKGYLDVLSAINILVNEFGKKVEAHFCGSFHPNTKNGKVISIEEQEIQFHGKIVRYGLENAVVYHSFVDGKEKIDILNDSNIMILPTYYQLEGQPISLIEGMAYQLPLIGTEYRGIKSEIIPGYNGLFVPPRSPLSIAEAVLEITSSKKIYLQFSQNSRRLFEKNFHKDVRQAKLISIICGEKN